MRWDFFVRHYADDERQRRDPKYIDDWTASRSTACCIRAPAALGGCTAHNAMIFVCPYNSDWNQLADLTGDASWRAEPCAPTSSGSRAAAPRRSSAARRGSASNPSRHGWSGWLYTENAIPDAAFRDRDLRSTILDSARAA